MTEKRRAAMGMDNQGLTVQTMNFSPGKGPVFYASLPCGSIAGQIGPGQRHHLISRLWNHLLTVKNDTRDAFPIQVVKIIQGPLGRPQLLLAGQQGPAISFCESGKTLWAALCEDPCDIGIDVAESLEFQGKYPFYRVFHPQELWHALKPAGKDVVKAAALLWSVKEAVAKALGCGFHLVDPLQMIVYPSTQSATAGAKEEKVVYDFPVGLSGKAAKRFPMAQGRSLRVHSICHGKMWLSIALLNRQSQ